MGLEKGAEDSEQSHIFRESHAAAAACGELPRRSGDAVAGSVSDGVNPLLWRSEVCTVVGAACLMDTAARVPPPPESPP